MPRKIFRKKAIKEMVPLQPGDMQSTFADVDALKNIINYQPKVNLDEGIKNFVTGIKTISNISFLLINK